MQKYLIILSWPLLPATLQSTLDCFIVELEEGDEVEPPLVLVLLHPVEGVHVLEHDFLSVLTLFLDQVSCAVHSATEHFDAALLFRT